MPFTKKNIAFGLLVILLVFAIYFYKEYHRKPSDITNTVPAIKIDAAQFVEQYLADEAAANKKYLNKTVQVTGVVSEIINQKDTMVNLILGKANALHGVSCVMDKRHIIEINNYSIGKPTIIKGICTGFLNDVELNNCVMVLDKNK